MAWYGQKNYSEKMGVNGTYTIAQIGCFITAFCNLGEKFGNTMDPATANTVLIQQNAYLADPADGAGVKDDVGWNTITVLFPTIKAVSTGGAGWPDTNNAIVKFAYNSPTSGQPTTHFCLVADQNAHTIVDSYDGVIRSPGYYGSPVAYATYENIVPQPVVVPAPVAPAPEPVDVPTTPSPRPGRQYTFQKGDSFYSIAPRFQTSAAELMDYNDITDAEAHNIPVGFSIYIPPSPDAATSAPATTGYTIEPLSAPQTWHIIRDPSATKWGFGNVKQWSDFVPNGSVPVNTNINIVAVATVIIGKDTAAYYMDTTAYDLSAKTVKTTIGYNWSDLAEGAYTAAPAPVVPEPAPATVMTPTPVIPAPAVQPSTTDPNAYKDTWRAFPKPQTFIVDTKKPYLMCPDCDGKRPAHQLLNNQAVSIAGTFIKGQTLYGRPSGAVKANPELWFGVPMDGLVDEKIIHDTMVSAATKYVMKYPTNIDEKITTTTGLVAKAFMDLKSKIMGRK